MQKRKDSFKKFGSPMMIFPDEYLTKTLFCSLDIVHLF